MCCVLKHTSTDWRCRFETTDVHRENRSSILPPLRYWTAKMKLEVGGAYWQISELLGGLRVRVGVLVRVWFRPSPEKSKKQQTKGVIAESLLFHTRILVINRIHSYKALFIILVVKPFLKHGSQLKHTSFLNQPVVFWGTTTFKNFRQVWIPSLLTT